MTEYDPRLVAPTCLYMASKAEESTVQARLLVFYIKKICMLLIGLKIYLILSHMTSDLKALFCMQILMISIGMKSRTYLKWK